MNVYIKDMMCLRCVMVVKAILTNLEIDFVTVELGVVKLRQPLTDYQFEKFRQELNACELDVLPNKKSTLIEQIKILIRTKMRSADIAADFRFSEFLSSSMHHDYTYLANVFSEIEGVTIERFYIEERITRVKELLQNDELSVKEISYILNFSSVPHLCSQFKKITGLTTAAYKLKTSLFAQNKLRAVK
ncbi:MAG: AraC family transcriptional regulator [Flavitalea sp.]